MKLKNIYGNTYDARYPDEEAVKMAKREYGKQIGRHTREAIHEAYEELKRLKQGGGKEYQFPDPDLVLGLMKATWRAYLSLSDPKHPDYQAPALEDLTKKDENVKQGNKTFTSLKGLFK